MAVNAAEAIKHVGEAKTAWAKLGQRLTELKVPTAHDAWKQHRELGLALDNVVKDVGGTAPATPTPVPAPATPAPAPIVILPAPPRKPWVSKAGLPFLFGFTCDNGNAGWDKLAATFPFPIDVVTSFHAQGVGKNTQYSDSSIGRPQLKILSYALIPAKVDNQPTPADGYTLAAAAQGAHDSEWVEVGKKFAGWGMNNDLVVIRLGWESDGSWYSWSATSKSDWKGAYEHAVRAIKRGIVDAGQTVKLRFDLCYNLGTSGGSSWSIPAADTYDVVSLDTYDFAKSADAADFARKVISPANKPGLDDVLALAQANGKLVGIPEFGSDGDDLTAHVAGIIDWAAAHADWVAYLVAFDGGSDTPRHSAASNPRNWSLLRTKLSALRK